MLTIGTLLSCFRTVCNQQGVKHDEQVVRVPKSLEVLCTIFSDGTDVHNDHDTNQNVPSDACNLRVRDLPEFETSILWHDRCNNLCWCRSSTCIGDVVRDTARCISAVRARYGHLHMTYSGAYDHISDETMEQNVFIEGHNVFDPGRP